MGTTLNMSDKGRVHRKLIDLPESVFTPLTLKAATMGMSLKKLIETILEREAEQSEEALIYKYLVVSRPEGQVMLSSAEQEAFEKRMGIVRDK